MLSAATFQSAIKPAEANPFPPPPVTEIYIRGDGSVDPSTAPITQNWDIYTLTDDIENSSLIVQCDNIVIDGEGFTLQGNGYYTGVVLHGRNNITIMNLQIKESSVCVSISGEPSNSKIFNNTLYGGSSGIISSSTHVQIIGNTIVDSTYGINGPCSFSAISRNTFIDTSYGLRITGSDNTIEENVFEDEVSIFMPKSQFNTISKNVLIGGIDGIVIYGSSSYNQIFGNNVTGKVGHAMEICDSCNNTVYENSLISNEIGIYLANPAFPDPRFAYATDNNIYRNNFVNNIRNVYIEQGVEGGPRPNNWDDGKEGNYWDNFTGVDNDGDGIGDAPYVICANNTDQHPLMKAVELSVDQLFPSPSPTPSQSASPSPSTSPTPFPTPYLKPSQSASPSNSPTPTASLLPSPSIPEFSPTSMLTICVMAALLTAFCLTLERRKNSGVSATVQSESA